MNASSTGDRLATLPNVFQRLMLQWERFGPYNAAQYMTLGASLDDAHVANTWRDVVITLGLQQVGQHPDHPPSTIDAAQAIEAFITAELNRPFVAGDSPLRPFVLRVDASTTHVGIVYRHVVADSASIRLVMREWFDRLLARRSVATSSGHVGLMRDARTVPRWQMIRAALREPVRIRRITRVRRLPGSMADPASAVAWRRVALPDGFITAALSYARRQRVKLNDVFVAAAADVCELTLPHEESHVRPDVGIGTIVDVRPPSQPPTTHFGLSLGFIQTFWRDHDFRSWDAILRTAARQSRLARERNDAGASQLRIAVATWCGTRADDEELATIYRKRCPLAAGISNVNLNLDWPTLHHPSPLRAYTRVSPLGPMLPIVFTPTTLGTTCHLGVTYRTGLIDEPMADVLIGDFVARLTSIV